MKNCPVCEKTYSDDVTTCETDGALLKSDLPGPDPYVGHLIRGRYRVLSELAQGAMGTLYVAEQVAIQKKVALKILNRRYAEDDEFIQRFHREARLAAGVNHPNIVTVLDFDQMEDGGLFIAMEFVDGITLGELIKQEGALDISKAVRLGIQLADGLSAAHGAGVIHRDIKPDNLMIMGDGEALKIMDFGIARSVDSGGGTRLTRVDVIMGTPEYMSPEQVNGNEANEQSEIYACGVVLYEMLTANLPCKAPTPGATLLKQVSEVPTAVRELRHEIPVAVERVVMQALEKNPEKRQRSSGQLCDELRKAAASIGKEPVAKTIMATQVIAAGEVRRRRLGWQTAAGACIAALGVVGYMLVGGDSAPVASTPVVPPIQSVPESFPPIKISTPVEDQSSGGAVEPRPPVVLPKQKSKPAELRSNVIKDNKPGKVIEVAAAAQKPAEATTVEDNKKRIDDAIKRLEAREGKTQIPLATPSPAPPSPPPAPKPEPPPPPQPAVNTAELAKIRGLVEQKLRSQGLLKVSESDRWGVSVDASGSGVITLRGLIRDQKLRDDAVRLTREVPGVAEVRVNVSLPEGAENRQ
jgi:serine/threonine protein kinase